MENTERKIILVPHCFMTKRFASSNRTDTEEVLNVLFNFKTGILQMPCPHLVSLMNDEKTQNERHPHCSGFIKKISQNPESMYADIIPQLLIQIEKYKQLDFEITGLIGIKDSPVCGIKKSSNNNVTFTNILNKELHDKGIHLRVAAI